ncbi:MAG: Hsp20/alpha crystallin family protein [Lentisphaerae bacterium]|jgi:HSP20 family protein|nr:Hsp20/alpha crystallin family protein [Victivallaceae bacterium]NLK83960.1 Hsp20/alpha crystallin family protein [Lentisphaerota bacterium]
MLLKLYDNLNSMFPFKPAELNRHLISLWDDLHEGVNRYLTGYPGAKLENGEDAITVKVCLPGMKMEDIDVEVVSDFLTIKAAREQTAADDEDCIYRERRLSRYEEKIKLPGKVKGSMTAAKYVDGILTVTMPREETEKPISIKVS